MKIAVAQFNPTVGDFEGNTRRLVALAREAHAAGARIVVTPELAICGYMPEDLLLRPAFIAASDAAVARVVAELAGLQGLHLVLGHPIGSGESTHSTAVTHRFNVASVYAEGRLVTRYAKAYLPNYQVFDERRYFAPGEQSATFDVDGVRFGLAICEDIWFDQPAEAARRAGVQVLLVPNASPFHRGKAGERERRVTDLAARAGLSIVYAHLVGGQDELVFDGASFVADAHQHITARSPAFREHLLLLDVSTDGQVTGELMAPESDDALVWRALVTGVRDYIGKNGFPGAVLGLSGGIDSALVLAIAVDALGADKVRAVMMPSPYTADISWLDARDMAARLEVRYDEIAIAPTFDAFRSALAPVFGALPEDTTEENIQARVRGTLLMAISNKTGVLVLTTGNKSELATGYCTLYGDMAGGYAAIKDVAKTLVYRLARWRNAHDPYGRGTNPIPERIITRPPSAELRPGQVDQDSLPPYETLDAILGRYVEEDQSIEEIVAAGFLRSEVERVTRLVKGSEYKRRQLPVGTRITHRAFGRDWRYPITSRFRA